ncbi:hypothetical protein COO60DRAFT_413313 [Scenedesmus sp. NREL 46B-D3]|nr:hypothetical protein COO60DRAFT_413313 [Scenedesmus sp. NREL 46B-D3]
MVPGNQTVEGVQGCSRMREDLAAHHERDRDRRTGVRHSAGPGLPARQGVAVPGVRSLKPASRSPTSAEAHAGWLIRVLGALWQQHREAAQCAAAAAGVRLGRPQHAGCDAEARSKPCVDATHHDSLGWAVWCGVQVAWPRRLCSCARPMLPLSSLTNELVFHAGNCAAWPRLAGRCAAAACTWPCELCVAAVPVLGVVQWTYPSRQQVANSKVVMHWTLATCARCASMRCLPPAWL